MTVKELIRRLKKMPQDAGVGLAQHDYDLGDSDSVSGVHFVGDEEPDNDRGVIDHPVVIS